MLLFQGSLAIDGEIHHGNPCFVSVDGYKFLVILAENIIYEDDIFEDIYWMGTNSSAGRPFAQGFSQNYRLHSSDIQRYLFHLELSHCLFFLAVSLPLSPLLRPIIRFVANKSIISREKVSSFSKFQKY